MCGIVGFVTHCQYGFNSNEVNAWRDMLVLDTLRGMDSTGCFGVSNKGNVEILKEAEHGFDFVRETDFHSFARKAVAEGQFLVGHNRAATRGAVSDVNAHPFWVDDKIVLVQNGTMRGDHKQHADVEVDSHAIAHVLAKEPDVEKALQKINAAYALVWYNVEEKTLYLLRNDERPLYLAYTQNDGLLFASEAETILYAASRNQVTLKEKPYMLKEHVLVSYTLGDDKEGPWKHKSKPIDSKYKYSFPVQQQFPHHSKKYDESTLLTFDEARKQQGPFGTNNNGATGRVTHFKQKSEISKTFYEWCWSRKFLDWEVHGSCNEITEACLQLRGQTVTVELVDYLAGNSYEDCRIWYLIGSIVAPDNNGEDRLLMYTIVKDKTEQEVYELMGEEFVHGTVTTISKTRISDPKEEIHIVSSFFHSLIPVSQLSQETVKNVH